MELPLTPLDFLLRAGGCSPTETASSSTRRARACLHVRRLRRARCDRLAQVAAERLRVSTRRPGRVAVRQHPRAARGVLRRAARRRGAAAAQHPARGRRAPRPCSTTAGATVLFRHPISSTDVDHPVRQRRCSATSTRRCWPHSRRLVDRPPRRRRARRRRALLHERLDRDAEGGAAHAPRPVPPRHPHRAHAGHQRRRRRAPHDPALPRERLGHAALRHRPRRRARDAAALRRRPRCCGSSRPSGSRGCSWCRRW